MALPDDPTTPDDGTAWREYLFFREELRHEDNLINQRVSWLISSQAFLLGGFAALLGAAGSSNDETLRNIRNFAITGLPVTGILGVLAGYVTILAAVLHVRGILRMVAHRRVRGMPPLDTWHTLQRRMGLFGPLVTPLIFVAFWIVILVKIL